MEAGFKKQAKTVCTCKQSYNLEVFRGEQTLMGKMIGIT